ncbi:hypothetical protein QUF76_05040 [Desulfobacterales bacterium HSG16]|nr:hypothetical protein [Desulfobacterales bacterium HSG16]
MSKSHSTNKVCKHLERMTKNELIHLILTLAPPNFIKNISSQFATQKEALALLKKTTSTISNILSDEELLYSPSEFEHELLQQLEKIRGLWEKLPTQIGELIIKIIEDVEQAFESGYLYIEKQVTSE